MSLTREQIAEIIMEGEFDKLIGLAENEWLECKGKQYQTQHDQGILELAKDVVSFANATGGFLLLGIKTERSTDQQVDVIRHVRPFDSTLVNCKQYADLLRSWIYPEVGGLKIDWTQRKGPAGKRGIVVIEIPRQREDRKPFLIVRHVEVTGKRTEIVFGFAERKGAASVPTGVAELHQLLRDGRIYSTLIGMRFDELQSTLQTLVVAPSSEPSEQIDLDERTRKALEAVNMTDRRAIILSAMPQRPAKLKTIFGPSNPEHGIVWKLEHPPVLRDSGWSLETLDQARIVAAEFRRVTNGDRRIIDLYRDGTLIFAASADAEMLSHYCWGRTYGQPKINSVALVESVYNFLDFYQLVIEDMEIPMGEYQVRLDFRNLHRNNERNYLMPYAHDSSSQVWGEEPHYAPDNCWTKTFSFSLQEISEPAVAAYRLIGDIYVWFGMDTSKIPYVTDMNGLPAVDTKKIAAIR
jgi:hypothetical protein